MTTSTVSTHKVVTRDKWTVARKELLAKEKELTRARDALSEQRRALPWVKVEKQYIFDTIGGKRTLAELFDGRSQLIIYSFMWRREFGEGCVGCSFLSDHLDGANLHLSNHDVSLVVVSRAPLADLQAFKERMGWRFPWVSSSGSDFNFDYHVSFTPEQLATGEVYYNRIHVPRSHAQRPRRIWSKSQHVGLGSSPQQVRRRRLCRPNRRLHCTQSGSALLP